MIKDLKILIVDNDKMVRLLLNRLISKKFKAEVLEAEDGLQALTVIKEKKPHMIILDITMPVMDGVEVMQNLRASEEFKDLPVIIMSSTDEKNTVMKLVQLKIADYILKPIDISKAYERIQGVLDKIEREYSIPKPIQVEQEKTETNNEEQIEKKILIVHSDGNVREELGSLLGNQYEIFQASTGIEALQAFLKNNIPFVVMGDGIQLINEISLAKKMIDKNPKVKIVHLYTNFPPTTPELFVKMMQLTNNLNDVATTILNSFN